MATPFYDMLKSVVGDLFGLDNTNDSVGDPEAYAMGRDLQGLRLFRLGLPFQQGCDYKLSSPYKHNDYFDDFLGPVLSTARWNALHGSDGSAATALHIAPGGTVRLTTGAGSTHTMAVNGSQITSALNFLVSNGGLRFETRLGKISALTSQSICFGLVDASTLSAPFTISGTTVTATGTNGVAFVQDAAATGVAADLNAVAINAGGSPQIVNLTQSVDTAAFHVYRIEVDSAGNATFFIDGALVATIALAVATTSNLCMSVGMFSEATSASQTLDIDYNLAQMTRV